MEELENQEVIEAKCDENQLNEACAAKCIIVDGESIEAGATASEEVAKEEADDNEDEELAAEKESQANESEDKESELAKMLAEAEARGYERGRSDGIEAWMNEGREELKQRHDIEEDREVMILNHMRKSVWG